MCNPTVLSFGEILWDLFPDSRVIGGAPFNFAAHLSKLGAKVTLVSAVGQDELGEAAAEQIRAMGMEDICTSRLADYTTGFCKVTLKNGTPSYDLKKDVAYDHIPFPASTPKKVDALYCGTLASRTESSFATLKRLLREVSAGEVFFDVNIRGNNWSAELLKEVLPFATVLKFSREEASVLAEALSLPTQGDPCLSMCHALAETYKNLRQILVTLDKDGSFVYLTESGSVLPSPKPHSKAISTVGAGDSFSACYVYNLLTGADTETCIRRATALSDYVVTQLGAVPDYPAELIPLIK